jgi:hypothetical protein
MRIANQLLIWFGLIFAVGCSAPAPVKVTSLPAAPLPPSFDRVVVPVDSSRVATVLAAPGGSVHTLIWTPNPLATWTVIVASAGLSTPRSQWPIYARVLNAVTNTCLFTNNGAACFFAARSE